MSKSLEEWVSEDRQIAERAESATAALMEHRYRATSEGNLSARQYAEALGISHTTVLRYVKGWGLWRVWQESGTSPGSTPLDAYAMATMSATKRAAVETVAAVAGIGAQTAERRHGPEVQRARTVIESAPDIETGKQRARAQAERLRAGHEQRHEREQVRRESKSRSALNIERELDKARRALVNALGFARDSGTLDGDNVEVIEDLIGRVRDLLELVNLAVVGGSDVDWDTELTRLEGE